MNTNPRQHYNSRIKNLKAELTTLSKYFHLFYTLRASLFLCALGCLTAYIKTGYTPIYLWLSALSATGFLGVVRWDLRYHQKQQQKSKQLLIQQNEIKYLDHQYLEFDNGKVFHDINPALSGDFDLFGEGSVFQYLNRSVTLSGQEMLAKSLCTWSMNPSTIRKKQEAIEELSQKPQFIETFRALGMLVNEKGDETNKIRQWLNQPIEKTNLLKLSTYIYPFILATWIGFIIYGVAPFSSVLIPLISGLTFVFLNHKRITRAHHHLNQCAITFQKYATLIRLAEKETFRSSHLSKIQARFTSNNLSAADSLARFFKLLEQFDYRNNIIVSLILNGLFLFDLRTFCKLTHWKEQHKTLVEGWFESLFETDALISYAVFAFNNREFLTLPEPVTGPFVFEATELGHPLLAPGERINNSVSFQGKPQILVITGANMAGKSTFLRTLAINLILALNGAPVCARQFRFSPCPIVSSINIRDSLTHHESYFYAELVRLKSIIEKAQQQPGPLIFLDEILRGTNSKDKQTGAMGYLKKLMELKACVVMATHDLAIGQLEKQYPEVVSNYCFEVELEQNHLVFDYKLKNGISKKLNASFLMKKMELIN